MLFAAGFCQAVISDLAQQQEERAQLQKALEEEKAAHAELAMQVQSHANFSSVSFARMCACVCGCISQLSWSDVIDVKNMSLRLDISPQLAYFG